MSVGNAGGLCDNYTVVILQFPVRLPHGTQQATVHGSEYWSIGVLEYACSVDCERMEECLVVNNFLEIGTVCACSMIF